MTTQEALDTLEQGGEWPALAEAIGVVVSDPMTSLDALLLGLNYKGIVAEQAALGLYRRTFRPIPNNRRMLSTDAAEWRRWLSDSHTGVMDADSEHASPDVLAEWLTRGLTREERIVLLLRYCEQMTMAEIGCVLNLSESRVSEIHEITLQRLRDRCGDTVSESLQKIA